MGHEVTEPPREAEDPDILSLAKDLDAVVVTQDLDYSQLLAKSQDSAPSVISLRLQIPHPSRVTSILASVLDQYRETIEKGAVLSVDDTGRARVRFLPIKD